jgi:hypothetical protein
VPYEIRPVKGGEKVFNTGTGHAASSRPLDHVTAVKQFRLLEGLERGWEPTGKPSAMTPHDEPGPGTQDKISDS